MSVILKRPWTRQPQIAAAVNPLLAKDCFVWVGSNPLAPTYSGKTLSPTSLNTIFDAGVAGRMVTWTDTSTTSTGIYLTDPLLPFTELGYTILVVAQPTSEATARYAFAQKVVGSFVTQVSIGFNAGVTIGDEAGSVDVYARNTGANSYNTRATSQIDGGLHCWVASASTASCTMFRDGVSQTLATGDLLGTGTYYEAGARTIVGNLYADFPDRFSYPLFLVAVWPRQLNAAKQQALSRNPWQLFAPLPRRIWAPSAAGRVAVATDTVSLSDSAVSQTNRVSVAVDTLTVSDSAAAITTRVAAASDSATFTDSAVAVSTLAAVAVDTVAFSDSAVSGASFPATASDTVAFTDSAAAVTTIVAAASDTAAFTDSATAIATITAAAADTFTVTDSAVASSSLVAAASDTVAFTDSAVGSRSGALAANGVDSVSFSDSAAAISTLTAAASDSITLTDSAAASSSLTAAAADTVAFTDSAVGSVGIVGVADAADTVTFSDSAEASVIPGTQANDGGHDWRTYGMLRKVHVAAEDSVQFSDAAEARIAHQVPFSAYLMASTVISQAQDSITLSDEAQAAVVRHARGIEQWELARTRLQLARDGTPSEAMEGRMANAELALQALWDLLGHLQPPDTQTAGDRIMREYADASKSLGAPVRGTFVRDES